MSIRKRIMAIGLSAMLMTGLCACGGGSGTGAGASTQQSTAAESGSTAEDSGSTAAGNEGVADDCMQKIFELLTKEGSSYSELKTMDPSTTYTEELNGNTITFTAKGEYVDGSCDFNLEGEHIVYKSDGTFLMGSAMFSYVSDAVAEYLEMDKDLMNGLIKAVSAAGLECDYVSMETDEATGEGISKLYVGGPYDFGVMDQVCLDADMIEMNGIEKLTEDDINYYVGAGKVNMFFLGNKTSSDYYFAEHGGLTELTYKSVIEAVKVMQPDGYEAFLDEYTSLSEADTEGYQAEFVTDRSELPEFYSELDEHHEFLKLHFGGAEGDGSSADAALPPYSYGDPTAKADAIYRYVIDSYSERLGAEEYDVVIPYAISIAEDESSSDDVKVLVTGWVTCYDLVDDVLEMRSGSEFSGAMHLVQSGDGYEVTSFDEVQDGALYDSSAKEIFGEHYDAFINLDSDLKAEAEKQVIIDYVTANGLEISGYRDFAGETYDL